mgnify:CR=1 FL=1
MDFCITLFNNKTNLKLKISSLTAAYCSWLVWLQVISIFRSSNFLCSAPLWADLIFIICVSHRLGAGQSQTKLETVRSVYSACSLGAGGLVTLASLVTAHLLSLDRVTHYHSHNSRDQLMMSVQW